jgi:acetyl-CoA carboxylase biotin carboxyl carrier protein
VVDLKSKIDDLAKLMEEFGLEESRLTGDAWSIEFSRSVPGRGVVMTSAVPGEEADDEPIALAHMQASEGPANLGTAITSPMTGIYYTAPNPGAAEFVKEGDRVTAGQVVGLIEAMKVFNEITATISGVVTRVEADNGRLVQPGDPLLYIA